MPNDYRAPSGTVGHPECARTRVHALVYLPAQQPNGMTAHHLHGMTAYYLLREHPQRYLPQSRSMFRIQGIPGDTTADAGLVGSGFLAVFEVPAALLRTASVTLAPAVASARAVSTPIPLAPPVTIARLPPRSTPATTSMAVVVAPNGA